MLAKAAPVAEARIAPAAYVSQSFHIPRVALNKADTHEILVVASKLKAFIKDRGDMNTSADVMERLSDYLRSQCDQAIAHAKADGRKTVMARDFVSGSK